jgi:hypothetical protein
LSHLDGFYHEVGLFFVAACGLLVVLPPDSERGTVIPEFAAGHRKFMGIEFFTPTVPRI